MKTIGALYMPPMVELADQETCEQMTAVAILLVDALMESAEDLRVLYDAGCTPEQAAAFLRNMPS